MTILPTLATVTDVKVTALNNVPLVRDDGVGCTESDARWIAQYTAIKGPVAPCGPIGP